MCSPDTVQHPEHQMHHDHPELKTRLGLGDRLMALHVVKIGLSTVYGKVHRSWVALSKWLVYRFVHSDTVAHHRAYGFSLPARGSS